ncbi:class I SAM-dependent methyltransferase [bacterium]|nr:class I SAM-dependent methyltransferase [bacterium]
MSDQNFEKWIDWEKVDPDAIMSYKEISEKIFAPVYKVLAKQVVDDYGIDIGTGIDIGAGTGGFACEIAKITRLKIFALDKRKEMIKFMEKRIENENLTGRVIPESGDAHKLPFDENYADLIVSRGSFQFWRDKSKVFSEIHRVLKIGGIGFIGGGFGKDKKVREKAMRLHEKIYKSINNGRNFKENLNLRYSEIGKILNNQNDFRINFDESGLWVVIKKS